MSRGALPRIGAALVAVAGALLLAGCETSPIAPPASPAATSLPVLVVGADGASNFVQADAVLATEAGTSRALSATKEVDGALGGWLQCGRFILAIPPGAFDSVGTVTISMPDSTAMVVDLEIEPASRNQFALPVVLACNTTGCRVDSDSVALYWYDPDNGAWVGMASEKSLSPATDCMQSLTITGEGAPDLSYSADGLATRLYHFSRYCAGKAGW